MVTLFDPISRLSTDEGRLYGEPDFTYTNRSGRAPIERFRVALERWFSRYPTEHSDELRQRVRARNNELHRAAVFELVLHEMLLSAGLRCEVHPGVPGSDRRPDFGVLSQDGELLTYIEAVRASGVSADAMAAEKRIEEVYRVLDGITSPDFFVGLRLNGWPRSSPRAREMREFLVARLSQTSHADVSSLWDQGMETVPHWHYVHDGWDVGFFPMPKRDEHRGEPGIRPLGMFFQDAHSIDPVSEIRAALRRKSGRYGHLGAPFVIAVNAAGMAADTDAAMKALFGTFAFRFPVNHGPSSGTWFREPNGFWFAGTSARNTRVSAVLHVDYTHPTAVASASVTLIENPWAVFPPVKLPKIPRYEVRSGSQEFHKVGGLPMFELLGVDAADFPGQDAD